MFDWLRSDRGTAADIYIDLGTANTIISARGHGIILNEPSLVAFSENSPGKKKILGVVPALCLSAKNASANATLSPVNN